MTDAFIHFEWLQQVNVHRCAAKLETSWKSNELRNWDINIPSSSHWPPKIHCFLYQPPVYITERYYTYHHHRQLWSRCRRRRLHDVNSQTCICYTHRAYTVQNDKWILQSSSSGNKAVNTVFTMSSTIWAGRPSRIGNVNFCCGHAGP